MIDAHPPRWTDRAFCGPVDHPAWMFVTPRSTGWLIRMFSTSLALSERSDTFPDLCDAVLVANGWRWEEFILWVCARAGWGCQLWFCCGIKGPWARTASGVLCTCTGIDITRGFWSNVNLTLFVSILLTAAPKSMPASCPKLLRLVFCASWV